MRARLAKKIYQRWLFSSGNDLPWNRGMIFKAIDSWMWRRFRKGRVATAAW